MGVFSEACSWERIWNPPEVVWKDVHAHLQRSLNSYDLCLVRLSILLAPLLTGASTFVHARSQLEPHRQWGLGYRAAWRLR